MTRRTDFLIGVCLSIFVFVAFYVPRLAPSVLFEPDSAEFQVLGYYLGIPHGTGYPVYIWLLKAFMWLPVGDIGYRANLFSAVCASAAIGFLYAASFLALPVITPVAIKRWSAGCATLITAYTYTLWNQAIRAEVYTLHALFCLAIVFMLLRWYRNEGFGNLAAASFLWGLGLGHHRQILAFVPAAVIFLLAQNRSRFNISRLGMLCAAVAAAIGIDVLLFYLLWIRNISFDQLHTTVMGAADLYGVTPEQLTHFWKAFYFQSSGKQFMSALFVSSLSVQWHRIFLIPLRLIGEFFLTGALLIAIGFAAAWREWRIQLLFCLWAVAVIVLNVNYSIHGTEVYFIALYLVCGIWLAHGISILLQALSPVNALLAPIACLALLLANPYSAPWLPGIAVRWFPDDGRYVAVASAARPNLTNSYRARDTGREFVSAVPQNSLVFGPYQMQYVVQYVARIERGITTLEYYESTPFSGSRKTFSDLYLQKIRTEIAIRPVLFIGPPPKQVTQDYIIRDLGRSLYQLTPR